MPQVLFAHGEGVSLEKTVTGGYIDIGYDPDPFLAGGKLLLNFDLLQEKGGTRIPFDRVWVRMHKNNVTYLATGISRATLGPTTLVMQLPEVAAGDITISVRFEKGDGVLAEADFSIHVQAATRSFDIPLLSIALLLGVIVGAGSLYLVRRV